MSVVGRLMSVENTGCVKKDSAGRDMFDSVTLTIGRMKDDYLKVDELYTYVRSGAGYEKSWSRCSAKNYLMEIGDMHSTDMCDKQGHDLVFIGQPVFLPSSPAKYSSYKGAADSKYVPEGDSVRVSKVSRVTDDMVRLSVFNERAQSHASVFVSCSRDSWLEKCLENYSNSENDHVVLQTDVHLSPRGPLGSLTPVAVSRVVAFENYEAVCGKDAYKKSLKHFDVSDLQVSDVTVLSTDEAHNLPENVRFIGQGWWTRPSVENSNYSGFDPECGVRPALQIDNLESLGMNAGDKFVVNDKSYTVISDNMVLCDTIVDKCCFSKDSRTCSNGYDDSYLKQRVDAWSEEQGFAKIVEKAKLLSNAKSRYEETQNSVYKHALEVVDSGELDDDGIIEELKSADRMYEKLSKMHKGSVFVRDYAQNDLESEKSSEYSFGE